ncbi:MAG: DUF1361 domain-containing protein [Acholeplasmataceae bacterium]|nr:DUF1361 domain-containing protein [Acholeplasmataceae bacterium]
MKPLSCMNDLKNKSLYLAAVIYVIISIILGMILNNGLVIFLGWNMILATVPLVLTQIYSKQKSKFLKIGIAFLFLIFFPNAVYIMTDLIHFQNYTFFLDYPNIYAYLIKDWLIFAHLVIGALISSKIAIKSLQILLSNMKEIKAIIRIIGVNILFILSSSAIYIGRFIRFNSWEFYKINLIFLDIFNHFKFFAFFVFILFILHWVIFFVFYEKKEPMAQIK